MYVPHVVCSCCSHYSKAGFTSVTGFIVITVTTLFVITSFEDFKRPHLGQRQVKHIHNNLLTLRRPSTCGRIFTEDELLDRAVCRELLHTKNSTLLQHLIEESLPKKIIWSPDTNVEDHYVSCAADCNRFRSEFGYLSSTDHVTEEELEFPIAFSILAYEQIEQTERLLRLIYRPHNFYCLHIDAKSPGKMHLAASAIARCLQPNVFVLQPAISVQYGQISVVLTELECIRKLLTLNAKWKYFINLVGRDFPLRTNKELVRILKAYNGSNDIAGSTTQHLLAHWFTYQWINGKKTGKPKSKPPHGLKIWKGSTHIVARREFVDYALNDPKAKDFLDWCRDINVPDEHFFNTLNHNPHLRIPGSYTGYPDKTTLTRAKRWKSSSNCSGKYIRAICSASVGDLPWVTASPQLFLNKIRLELDPAAFRCLELWYGDRVRHEIDSMKTRESGHGCDCSSSFPVLTINSTDSLNLQFYASQSWAKNHL